MKKKQLQASAEKAAAEQSAAETKARKGPTAASAPPQWFAGNVIEMVGEDAGDDTENHKGNGNVGGTQVVGDEEDDLLADESPRPKKKSKFDGKETLLPKEGESP